MLVCAHMRGVTTLADDAGLGPLGSVCVHHLHGAIGFVIVLALLALAAGVGLGADADALAFFDEGDLGSDTDGAANDFCGS